MTSELNSDTAVETPAGDAGNRKRLVYCDTGIIVAIVMGEVDPFFDEAVRFLETVKSSGIRLVISNLTLAEAVDVIRKRIKANYRCTDDSGKEREAVDAAAAVAVRDLGRFINGLKADRMADMYEDITKARPDIARIYEKILDSQGKTPQARRGNTYRHEGIGPIDWLHIALARLAGARAICTTDKALMQVCGDKRCGGMEIILLRPQ